MPYQHKPTILGKGIYAADEVLRQLQTHSESAPTQVHSRSTQHEGQSPHAVPAQTNNSGQGHLFDASVQVPDEIQGWNWGAFFVPGVWCLTNHVWIGLLSWVDFSVVTTVFTFGMTWPIMAIILGVKGNEWAWKSRRWRSVKEFKRHQRLWAIAGFLIFIILLILIALIIVLILIALIIVGLLALGLASIGIRN